MPKDASQEDLFNLYEDFLTKIHNGDDIEFTLRHFELDLLDMLGYGLDFENDIDKNEQIDPDKNLKLIINVLIKLTSFIHVLSLFNKPTLK